MLCYRCGGHVKDGSEKCPSCGQQFALGLKPGPIAGFGAGSRRRRLAVEGAPCKPGDAIAGRFVIKEGLGAGPLGWVFRAADQESGELVALKILSPRFLQLPEERQGFAAQLQQTAAFEHPNTARVLAAGLDGDRPWVASALLEGLTLRRIMDLRRQKGLAFALHEIEPIAAQIAAALEAAPFVHGDLKPDNVMVLPDLLKLTDFSLGLCLPRVPFVAAQRAAGVQRYLAPELLSGERPGGRADAFALGAMVAEMLAGIPYETGVELRSKGLLPEGVETLVARAVAPRAQDRFASAAQFVAELSEALGGPPAPREDDVDIEQSQTDPRVRIARALAAQDEEEAVSAVSQRADPPASQQAPAPAAAPKEPARAQSPSLATAPSTAETNPGAAGSRPAPAPDPAEGPQPTGDEPTIQLIAAPKLPPLDLAPLAPLSLEPLAALPPLSVPPPISRPPAPQADAASAQANPLPRAPVPARAPELPLGAAPVQPAAPAEAPSPAPAAAVQPVAAAEPAPPPPAAASDDDAGDHAAGPGRGRKRRGKRGRKDEHRADKEQRRGSRDPEWAAGAGTPASSPGGDAATALGAETPAFQPLPAASFEEVAKALGTPLAPAPQAPLPARPPSDAGAGPALDLAAEANPLRPGPKSRPAAPRAAPAFGAIAEKKKVPVPLLVLGAAVVLGLVAFGVRRPSGDGGRQAEPSAPAPKAETPKAPEPVQAAEAAKPAEEPAKAAEPKPTPVERAPPAKAAEKATRGEPPPKGSTGKKKSFLERVRERREARLKAQEAALAEAASKRSGASSGAAPPAAAAPAPARAETSPPGGAIAGLDDSDSRVAAKTPKQVAALAPAPSIPANDAACPFGMKLVPAGLAHVGTEASDDLRNFGDRAAATVELKAFCIDLFEYPNKPGQLPKLASAFAEADASCKKEGKRLCSEDEWEKSCRGPQNLRFPYGPNFDANICNTQDRGSNPRKVTVVGIFGGCKSGYGVFDLSGNAAEWTASSFEPGGGGDKAVKGGSATRPGFDDRCSSRRRLAAGAHDVNVGFRCCSEAK